MVIASGVVVGSCGASAVCSVGWDPHKTSSFGLRSFQKNVDNPLWYLYLQHGFSQDTQQYNHETRTSWCNE